MNVLIADSDSTVRLELRTMLAAMGHTVVGEAENGMKAFALARNLRPDLLLLEVELPQVSGPDLADMLLAEWLAPCLLYTIDSGTATEAAMDRIGRCGTMGFFSKPLRSADIGPLIQIALVRWQQLYELDSEITLLNERIEARKLVGRAKAILMEKFKLQEREAFRRIQAQSAALNKPVHEIARAIITSHNVSG